MNTWLMVLLVALNLVLGTLSFVTGGWAWVLSLASSLFVFWVWSTTEQYRRY